MFDRLIFTVEWWLYVESAQSARVSFLTTWPAILLKCHFPRDRAEKVGRQRVSERNGHQTFCVRPTSVSRTAGSIYR